MTEVNTFFWPGPDLAPNEGGSYEYGELPAVVFNAIKAKILVAWPTIRWRVQAIYPQKRG